MIGRKNAHGGRGYYPDFVRDEGCKCQIHECSIGRTSTYKEDAGVLIDKDAIRSESLIGRESTHSGVYYIESY